MSWQLKTSVPESNIRLVGNFIGGACSQLMPQLKTFSFCDDVTIAHLLCCCCATTPSDQQPAQLWLDAKAGFWKQLW